MYYFSNLLKLEEILQTHKQINADTWNNINNLDTMQLN